MMRISTAFLRLTAAAALSGCAVSALPSLAQTGQAADNSKQNQNQTTTADNQDNAKSDRMITAHVRKAIIADKNLSIYAHNVKIITANGSVTLKGPVRSDEEKMQVAIDAASAVSPDRITNEITVKQ